MCFQSSRPRTFSLYSTVVKHHKSVPYPQFYVSIISTHGPYGGVFSVTQIREHPVCTVVTNNKSLPCPQTHLRYRKQGPGGTCFRSKGSGTSSPCRKRRGQNKNIGHSAWGSSQSHVDVGGNATSAHTREAKWCGRCPLAISLRAPIAQKDQW